MQSEKERNQTLEKQMAELDGRLDNEHKAGGIEQSYGAVTGETP